MDRLLVFISIIPLFLIGFYNLFGLTYLLIFLSLIPVILFTMQKIINGISSTYFTHTNPNHLIVIQHGWIAPWLRATPLGKGLHDMAHKHHQINNENRYLIHIVRSNSDDYLFGWIKTQDGIHKGGQRTCNEIKAILDEYKTIN
eukprot:204867_1